MLHYRSDRIRRRRDKLKTDIHNCEKYIYIFFVQKHFYKAYTLAPLTWKLWAVWRVRERRTWVEPPFSNRACCPGPSLRSSPTGSRSCPPHPCLHFCSLGKSSSRLILQNKCRDLRNNLNFSSPSRKFFPSPFVFFPAAIYFLCGPITKLKYKKKNGKT